ncbi:MAG: Eco57I restriction-modification methylase domain-containing protein [Bacteroidota bacterium]
MYGERSNGKQHGVVLTKPEVVKAILDLVGYLSDRDLGKVTILEPASGDGAFVLEIIARLHESSVKFEFDFLAALKNVRLFEIDPTLADLLEANIEALLLALGGYPNPIPIIRSDYLQSPDIKVDFVVGNPPYVRHDNIPEELRKMYRQRFSTFRYRSDLYVPFFEKSLRSLTNGGKLGFICANRWLRNQYGRPLRALISQFYSLDKVIDLSQTHPFQEEVIAYPAVTIMTKRKPLPDAEYYELKDLNALAQINESKIQPLAHLSTQEQDWFAELTLHEHKINCRLGGIEEQGFKIGIGVATGCDRVFVRQDFAGQVEVELLLPMIKSTDLKGDQFAWQGHQFLNPFDAKGKLIDLRNFPRAAQYFESNGESLRKRHVARKKPLSWYRTIDRVDSTLVSKPKILLPDISGNSRIFIDFGQYYPHHNLYYIIGRPIEKLQLLAAMLMSTFVRNQLKAVGTKMNGGYPRWQSQNLRKLKLPIIDAVADKRRAELIGAYARNNLSEIDLIVNELLQTLSEDTHQGQLELFQDHQAAQ